MRILVIEDNHLVQTAARGGTLWNFDGTASTIVRIGNNWIPSSPGTMSGPTTYLSYEWTDRPDLFQDSVTGPTLSGAFTSTSGTAVPVTPAMKTFSLSMPTVRNCR